MNHLLCFGYGYTASFLVKRLLEKEPNNWYFKGTSRGSLTDKHVKILNYNELSLIPPDTTHILISIPPNPKGDLVYDHFKNQITKLPNLKWMAYLSTTGVYGDHQGEWVTENDELRAQTPLGINRIKAEEQWRSTNLPLNIFRLSGIYGPSRSMIDKIKKGDIQIVDKPGQFFSRIHVEDIAQALHLSITLGISDIFNLADDYPSSIVEVAEFAYKLLDIPMPPPPPFNWTLLSETSKCFYNENKRVSNKKVKSMLGLQLKFPSFKQGLINIYN